MADPEDQAAQDASSTMLETVQAALRAINAGERLPAPKTWQEYAAGVVVWLNLRWHPDGKPNDDGPYRCTVCGSNDYVFSQAISLESDSRWPSGTEGQGTFPCAQIECKRCGQVQLLDLLLVFEPQQPRQQPPGQAPQS